MRRAVELQEEYACESKACESKGAHLVPSRTRRAHQITLVTSAHFARSLARRTSRNVCACYARACKRNTVKSPLARRKFCYCFAFSNNTVESFPSNALRRASSLRLGTLSRKSPRISRCVPGVALPRVARCPSSVPCVCQSARMCVSAQIFKFIRFMRLKIMRVL